MSQKFRLIELNQELGLKDGFYQNLNDRFRDAILNEKIEHSISSFFSDVSDKSLFSEELERASASLDHNCVASNKFHFLQTMNFSGINTALDISEDTGGVAHYIADKVGRLESLKIDPALARLAVKRCANKHNVIHISENIDKLSFPESYYDLIILGQIEELKLDKTQLSALLKKLQKALSPNGILVVNIANSERLNQWFDCDGNVSNKSSINSSINSSIPFLDLYQSNENADTCGQLSRKELRDTLLNANFPHHDIHVNFSKGNDCQALFSENYLTAAVNATNHFYQLNFIDNHNINEYLLAQSLVTKGANLSDKATRFIAIVGNNNRSLKSFYNNDFSYYPDAGIARKFQTLRYRARSAQQVEKRLAYDVEKATSKTSKNSVVTANLASTPFFKGQILIGEWLNALLNNEPEKFTQLTLEYSDYLLELSHSKDFQHLAYNALPANIILNERGKRAFNIANLKWQIKPELSANFVLFKALLDFAKDNYSLVKAYAIKNDLATIGLFILEYMPTVFQLEELAPFIAMETQIQVAIKGEFQSESNEPNIENFINSDLSQSNNVASNDHCKNDAAQNHILTGQAQQLSLYRQRNTHLQQQIEDLREHRTDVVEKIKEQTALATQTQARMQAEIDHLHERLHAQHVRNDELHGYLLMRPTTRAKRVARRTVNRLSGKPPIEQQALDVEPETIEEAPLLPLEGELIGQNTEDYDLWIAENSLSQSDIKKAQQNIEAMAYKPVFSILVPIYNTDPEYLLPMIESVRKQIYPYWQLCLVDDSSPKTYLKRILEHEALNDERISIQLNDVNQGISVTTNDALAIAKGDYIALLDHDDEISIDALYENAKVINQHSDVGLIYSDEDKMEMDGSRAEPYFKPDFSPDLLHTNNYICHFTVIKKSIAHDIGGFREGLDGSQDHDIIIRAAAQAERIVHIPKILYHWRKIPGSTAVAYDSKSYAWEAGRKAVEDQLQKQEDGVQVEFGTLKGTYRVHREIHGNPLVSIIIPFKDKPELLDSCLNSILNRSSYDNFEIIGVSNNSEQPLTFERMQHFTELDSRVKFVEKNIPFNFSAICNYGVEQAQGEYVLLLNNDIEVISPDWIEQLLQNAQRPEIGAVGGKLLYPDGRIQHAGVVAGMVGAAGHPHKFFPDNHIGYHGRLHMAYNVSAVTGAMMMIKTSKFKDVGGFDEDNLAVAYNDIDLCLKLLKKGLYNLFTPHAKATHHESISRGYEDTDEKMQRLLKEQSHFLTTWSDFLKAGDPFYNPNLSLKNERFSLNFKD